MADILGVAKEIVIAAIQNNKIIIQHSHDESAESLNERYANEVAKMYKTVSKTVYECYNKDFESK